MAVNSAVVGVLRAILTMDSAEFEKGVRKAQGELGKFSRETKTLGLQATQLGATLTKTVTLPLVGLGTMAAKTAIDAAIALRLQTLKARLRLSLDASLVEPGGLRDTNPDGADGSWRKVTVEDVIEQHRADLAAWREETLRELCTWLSCDR
jgi:hypothetical protein